MGRKSTGTVRVLQGEKGPQWHAKWTRADGTRTEWEPLPPEIDVADVACAKAKAASMAPRVRQASAGGGPVETVAHYAKRWHEWRTGRGLRCVTEDRTRIAHALPTIGHLPIGDVTRDDLKRLVVELDAKVQRGFTEKPDETRRPFGWKTADCVWGVVRSLFRDAQRAKRPDLCIREDNPADGIAGPDRGVRKAKTYLWPSEFLTLVSCERVPLRWRRLFALAVYTYARAGELAALEWVGDVDLDHGTIHVHRSKDDQRKRGTNPTKSNTARRVSIEPNLRPLLFAMHAETKGRGNVVQIPRDGLSDKLRFYLRRAGIERADLFKTDATRKAITFHDLRATGITWCAVRGDEALKISQRAGHADFETTRIYLREAENLSQGFGAVFPVLPVALQESPRNRPGRFFSRDRAKNKANGVAPPRLELGHPDRGRGF